MKKVSLGKLLGINSYWFGFSFMWNSLHPIVLPAILLNLTPNIMKNSVLGTLTFAGLILAMLIQPLSGATSDKWRSHWGRRRPLVLAGTLLDFLFLGLLAWSGSLIVVIVGYVGLQIASNIAQGPLQGLLPDEVPDWQMGSASSIKNLMDMGGLIAASFAASRLFSPQDRYPTIIMLVVIAVLAASALITLIIAREKPSDLEGKKEKIIFPKIKFAIDLSGNLNYFRLLAARFVFLIGIYAIQTFIQYYIIDVLQAPNPVKATGDLMVVLALAMIAYALLGGWLTDRIGARRVLVLASLVSAFGCFLLPSVRNLTMLALNGGILGAGVGLFLTANWAYANRLAPKAEAGKYLGLANLATAGASALSKLGGIPIDIANNANPGRFLGYSCIFVAGGLFSLASLFLLAKVKE